MTKKEYKTFASEIQKIICDFVNNSGVSASCKFPQDDEDNMRWTINLGEKFGSVNILIESWSSASFHGIVNFCSIPMRYHNFTDPQRIFRTRFGGVNCFNGKFVLTSTAKEANKLQDTFKQIVEIWKEYAPKKKTEQPYLCMN